MSRVECTFEAPNTLQLLNLPFGEWWITSPDNSSVGCHLRDASNLTDEEDRHLKALVYNSLHDGRRLTLINLGPDPVSETE